MDKNAGCYILGSVVDPNNMQKTIEKAVLKKTKGLRVIAFLAISAGAYYIHRINRLNSKLEERVSKLEQSKDEELVEADYHEGD